MDTGILVHAGQGLVDELDKIDMAPAAALWVHSTDVDTWKLWIVPNEKMSDQRNFYRIISDITRQYKDDLLDLNGGDVEMLSITHPAIQGLSRVFHITGKNIVNITGTKFNNFYLPDGVILRMNIDSKSDR